MRTLFIVFSIMVFSGASKASCQNINQINNYSSELEESLSELVETIYTHFPRRFNFYDLAVRAESDAKFLEFSTRSGLIKCSMAKRIFSGLDISFNILRNHILRFQRRRPYYYFIYESQWLEAKDRFNHLLIEVSEN